MYVCCPGYLGTKIKETATIETKTQIHVFVSIFYHILTIIYRYSSNSYANVSAGQYSYVGNQLNDSVCVAVAAQPANK